MTQLLTAPDLVAPDQDRTMILNMGPQHPSTHGVLRLVLEIDGLLRHVKRDHKKQKEDKVAAQSKAQPHPVA